MLELWPQGVTPAVGQVQPLASDRFRVVCFAIKWIC